MKIQKRFQVPGQYQRLFKHLERTLEQIFDASNVFPFVPPSGPNLVRGIPKETKPLRHAPKDAIKFTFRDDADAMACVTYEDGTTAEHKILDCGDAWELVEDPVKLITRYHPEEDPKEAA